jgi:hypothetical protein
MLSITIFLETLVRSFWQLTTKSLSKLISELHMRIYEIVCADFALRLYEVDALIVAACSQDMFAAPECGLNVLLLWVLSVAVFAASSRISVWSV